MIEISCSTALAGTSVLIYNQDILIIVASFFSCYCADCMVTTLRQKSKDIKSLPTILKSDASGRDILSKQS